MALIERVLELTVLLSEGSLICTTTISDSELESVIKLTEGISCGFYSGPLYLKNLDEDPIRDIKDLIIEKVEPDWMPKGNSFYKVEKAGQMENLKNVIEKYNKKLFDGVAEAVKYLKENEKQIC